MGEFQTTKDANVLHADADAQADLSLRWTHMSEGMFLYTETHFWKFRSVVCICTYPKFLHGGNVLIVSMETVCGYIARVTSTDVSRLMNEIVPDTLPFTYKWNETFLKTHDTSLIQANCFHYKLCACVIAYVCVCVCVCVVCVAGWVGAGEGGR